MSAALHSVVVPVYNEVEGIGLFHDRCAAALETIGDTYEILYVDDGSTDGSWDKLAALQANDPSRVRLIRLSRNFGHQTAISAGIERAGGDTVTVIDADLQDPPEVIPELVAKWREGADVIYAVRTQRDGETAFKRASAKAFYRVLRRLSDVDIPLDAGDFRLLSRKAARALCDMPEHNRFVRGMVAWLGFRTAAVSYVRDARATGVTKYPLRRMVALAVDGLLAFSTRPLRVATWVGAVTAVVGFIAGITLVVLRLSGDTALVQGWTSLAVIVLFMSGVQLVTIGVLGEYLGRVYHEVRRRPLYLLDETRGFAEDQQSR